MALYYATNRFTDLRSNLAGVAQPPGLAALPYWISDPKTEEEEQENKRTLQLYGISLAVIVIAAIVVDRSQRR